MPVNKDPGIQQILKYPRHSVFIIVTTHVPNRNTKTIHNKYNNKAADPEVQDPPLCYYEKLFYLLFNTKFF